MVDTYLAMLEEGRSVIEAKARRLKMAMLLLALATFAVVFHLLQRDV